MWERAAKEVPGGGLALQLKAPQPLAHHMGGGEPAPSRFTDSAGFPIGLDHDVLLG